MQPLRKITRNRITTTCLLGRFLLGLLGLARTQWQLGKGLPHQLICNRCKRGGQQLGQTTVGGTVIAKTWLIFSLISFLRASSILENQNEKQSVDNVGILSCSKC